MTKESLAEQLVAIIQEYLGPAADRFVARLISFHLGKEPSELTAKDIPKISNWIKVSLSLLTEDHLVIDDCEKKILLLGKLAK
jgi:hypothetical protein